MTKLQSFLISLVVVGFIFLSLIGWVLGGYNGMVTQRESVDASWSQVETQYQRRYDLIPNLVNATKGNLAQEQKVFKDIADARTKYAGSPAGSDARVQATGQVESALSRLLLIMENYPQLNSSVTIRALMDELAGTENRVNVARQRYNEEARDYNVSVKKFPNSILAGVFNFDPKPLFEAKTGADSAPNVNLEVK